jgi:hypothetical protein
MKSTSGSTCGKGGPEVSSKGLAVNVSLVILQFIFMLFHACGAISLQTLDECSRGG